MTKRQTVLCGVVYLIGCWGLSCLALAQMPPQPVSQQFHTQWTIRDGFPINTLNITQSTDGMLWLASETGLFRFDGVHFERYTPEPGNALLYSNVQAIVAPSTGGIWISYQFGGVSFIDKGVVKNYPANLFGTGNVAYFVEDLDGTVWACNGFGLFRFEGGQWKHVGADWNYTPRYSQKPVLDAHGNLWVKDDLDAYSVLRRGRHAFEATDVKGFGIARHFDRETDGHRMRDWIATATGLYELADADGRWVLKPTLVKGDTSVPVVMQDGRVIFAKDLHSFEEVWEGADGTLQASIDVAVRLASPEHGPIFQDREGSLWITSPKGIDRFRPTPFRPVPLGLRSSLVAIAASGRDLVYGALSGDISSDPLMRVGAGGVAAVPGGPQQVTAMYTDGSGTIWIGGTGKLWKMRDGRIETVLLPPDQTTASSDVQAIAMDSQGTLWVSIMGTGKYRVFCLKDGTWAPFTVLPEGGHPFPLTLLADHEGMVWIGYSRNRITRVAKGGVVSSLDAKDGLDFGTAITQYEHGDVVWIGGTERLGYVYRERYHSLTASDGRAMAGVSGIVQRRNGDVWLNTPEGIVRIDNDEVKRTLEDPGYRVVTHGMNYLDGVESAPSQVRPVPTCIETGDGRIYFSARGSLMWIDPDHLVKNAVVPSVYIASVAVDGRQLAGTSHAELAKGSQTMQISFDATSLLIPERVRFRYMLTPYDSEWQDAGTRRQAMYTKVPPGHYVFRVAASNNDGVWSEQDAVLPVDLPPTFLQSIGFKVLCGLTLLLLGVALYVLRVRTLIKRVQEKMDERIAERERIARDLHDSLFQNLYALMLRFNRATAKLRADDPARPVFLEALEQSDRVIHEGRDVLLDLERTSIDHQEMESLFVEACKEGYAIRAAEYSVEVSGDPRALQPKCAREMHRLGAEAIRNAFVHAQATRISVEIVYGGDELLLRVRDNGVGIEEPVLESGQRMGHMGLPSMRDRAAKMGAAYAIRNREGGGVEVEVRVPAAAAYFVRQRKGFAMVTSFGSF